MASFLCLFPPIIVISKHCFLDRDSVIQIPPRLTTKNIIQRVYNTQIIKNVMTNLFAEQNIYLFFVLSKS
jgi:hypothetical protein